MINSLPSSMKKRRHSFGSPLIHFGRDRLTHETRGAVLLWVHYPGFHLVLSALVCSGGWEEAGGLLPDMRAEEQRRGSEFDRLLRCSRMKTLGMQGWSIYIWGLLSRGISVTILRKSGLSANILEILAACGSLTRTLSRTAVPNIRSTF